MDEKQQAAQKVYQTMCAMLDNIKWKYNPDDKQLTVNTVAIGKDLAIQLNVVVSPERQLYYVKSPMPFVIPQDTRDVVGTAVNIANFSMLAGCFEYDVSSGYLGFKMVVPFPNCQISQDVCHYSIMLTCQMVDNFNDKFLALSKKETTLAQFVQAALG